MGYGKSDVIGSKSMQIPITTVRNFLAIGRRVSENEDLKEK